MKNDKINSNSVSNLIFALTKSSFLGSGFIYIFSTISKTSLFSVLFGLLISFLFTFIFMKVMNTLPDKNIYEKIEYLFPKWLFIIIMILIISSFFIFGSFLFFRSISFISTHFLTKTSSIAIMALIHCIFFYLSNKNLEVLTRFSGVAFVICALILGFNCFSLLGVSSIDNLKPIIITDASATIKTSLITALLFSGPMFLLTCIRKSDIIDSEKVNKKVWIYYIISAIALMIIFYFIVSSLGIELVSFFSYPEYVVLKKIKVLNFITSVENVNILLWFLYSMITTCFCAIFFKNATGKLLGIKSTKGRRLILISSMIVAYIIEVIIFQNDYSLDKPELIFLVAFTYVFFIIISLLILLIYHFKKKK